jgi:hypothetical protein
MRDEMHDAENDRADAEGHEHGDKRQQNDIDVSEVRFVGRALAHAEEARKDDTDEADEFHGSAPEGLGSTGVAPIELPSSSDRSGTENSSRCASNSRSIGGNLSQEAGIARYAALAAAAMNRRRRADG